jgi:hypothetical protein
MTNIFLSLSHMASKKQNFYYIELFKLTHIKIKNVLHLCMNIGHILYALYDSRNFLFKYYPMVHGLGNF